MEEHRKEVELCVPKNEDEIQEVVEKPKEEGHDVVEEPREKEVAYKCQKICIV